MKHTLMVPERQEADAADRFVDLIREHGKWVKPEVVPA